VGNLGHQAARLAASKICDNIVKGLCKDPETEVVKLIDIWQKFMGDEKIDLNYDSARRSATRTVHSTSTCTVLSMR
jgi:hypothetical protein